MDSVFPGNGLIQSVDRLTGLVRVGWTVRVSSSTAPFPEELHKILRSIAFHERSEITALVIKAPEKEYGSKSSTSGISGLVSAIP